FCIGAQAGCRSMDVAGCFGHFERYAWIEFFACNRVIKAFHKATRFDMFIFNELTCAEDCPSRYARSLQALHGLVVIILFRPTADYGIEFPAMLYACCIG